MYAKITKNVLTLLAVTNVPAYPDTKLSDRHVLTSTNVNPRLAVTTRNGTVVLPLILLCANLKFSKICVKNMSPPGMYQPTGHVRM